VRLTDARGGAAGEPTAGGAAAGGATSVGIAVPAAPAGRGLPG